MQSEIEFNFWNNFTAPTRHSTHIMCLLVMDSIYLFNTHILSSPPSPCCQRGMRFFIFIHCNGMKLFAGCCSFVFVYNPLFLQLQWISLSFAPTIRLLLWEFFIHTTLCGGDRDRDDDEAQKMQPTLLRLVNNIESGDEEEVDVSRKVFFSCCWWNMTAKRICRLVMELFGILSSVAFFSAVCLFVWEVKVQVTHMIYQIWMTSTFESDVMVN